MISSTLSPRGGDSSAARLARACSRRATQLVVGHRPGEVRMLVRAWRGYAALTEAQAYPKHLLQSIRPKLEQLAGFRGLYLLRRREPEEIEFLVLTFWESMDAVRAFAGEEPELAVVEP